MAALVVVVVTLPGLRVGIVITIPPVGVSVVAASVVLVVGASLVVVVSLPPGKRVGRVIIPPWSVVVASVLGASVVAVALGFITTPIVVSGLVVVVPGTETSVPDRVIGVVVAVVVVVVVVVLSPGSNVLSPGSNVGSGIGKSISGLVVDVLFSSIVDVIVSTGRPV